MEALAAMAVVFVALWWLLKALVWLFTQVVTYWRTSLTLLALAAWWHYWGWVSLALTLSVITVLLGVWRWVDLISFDTWAGRWLRAWWLRWTIYAPKLPDWLHACGLSITEATTPVTVTVNLVGHNRIRRDRHQPNIRVPKILGVKSGASWDEVRVRLVAGQKPEDFDIATRALACARGVARCQIRELAPNVVSIDFQRRNLLTTPVPCVQLTTLDGTSVELRRVWAGRTEYGQDWHLPLTGSASHTLTAGASGAGKNSVMWCPWSPSLRRSATDWSASQESTPKAWNWPTGGASSTATPSPVPKHCACSMNWWAGWKRGRPSSPATCVRYRSAVSIPWSCWSSTRSEH
jgi:DNA segregation ATPase FtsK/SpoIIIE, S-DNA-T family